MRDLRGNVHKSEQRNQNDEESEDDETKELVEGAVVGREGAGTNRAVKLYLQQPPLLPLTEPPQDGHCPPTHPNCPL